MTEPPSTRTSSSTVHIRAAIISQGDELTLGQTLDTNSQWLSRRLLDMGIQPVEHVTLPDDRDSIARAFRRLACEVDLILCSGGLGPTEDDLTRFALCDASNDTLELDPVSLAQIEAFFQARGRTMNPINRVQAMKPAHGLMLENPHGTAPGILSTIHTSANSSPRDCDIFCLPGPPRELFPMFEHHVAPRLKPPPGRTVRVRVLHTVGMGESDIAAALARSPAGNLMARDRQPLVGTTASGGAVSCRLRYEGPLAPVQAEELLDDTERAVRAAVGTHIFGTGSDTLAQVIVRTLTESHQTLSLAESCTGGLLGAAITDIPGSSAALIGGWISYANEFKQNHLAVPAHLFKSDSNPNAPGAVSPEVAAQMAQGGLVRSGSTHCLAITGIAGPGGAVHGKPVGTVFIALASKDNPTPDIRRFAMTGDRQAVRAWAVTAALAMLWLHLAGRPTLTLLRQVPIED